ncbi:MAG: TonB-dependent receptor plug domain-containing protein, partial [Thiohalomonadaceae bacterium]
MTFAIALSLNAPLVLAAPVEFNIPAQKLDKALDAFKAQAKVELVYSPAEVRNLEATHLEGAFEPAEALVRLIGNADLIIARTANGGYSLAPVRTDTTVADGLNKIVVAATRTEQRITDVPAAVSVITSADIAQQQVTRISDVVQNVEGVDVVRSATLGSSETITIRGVGGSFAGSTSQVLLDGMPLESPVTGIHVGIKALAIDDIERIEVVRGPSSALYGPSAVGGVVNLVSKRWER